MFFYLSFAIITQKTFHCFISTPGAPGEERGRGTPPSAVTFMVSDRAPQMSLTCNEKVATFGPLTSADGVDKGKLYTLETL